MAGQFASLEPRRPPDISWQCVRRVGAGSRQRPPSAARHPRSSSAAVALPLFLQAAILLRRPAVSAAGKPLYTGSKDVAEATPETFQRLIQDDRRAMVVVYYADWCGHCIHYAPVFKKIAGMMSSDPRIGFAALNCAQFPEFCVGVEVNSYPTIRGYHFPGLKSADTKRGGELPRSEVRSETSFPVWLAKQSLPELQPVAPPAGDTTASPKTPATGVGPATALAMRAAAVAGAEVAVPAPASPAALASPMARRGIVGSPASYHLIDAELALLYSFRQGVFLHATSNGSSTDGDRVLSGKALDELCAWLDFLADVLPNPDARAGVALLGDVARNARANGALEHSVWDVAIRARGLGGLPAKAGEDPTAYWRLCTTYTCGLWALFHLSVAGVAARPKPKPPRQGEAFLSAENRSPRPSPSSGEIRPKDAEGALVLLLGCGLLPPRRL